MPLMTVKHLEQERKGPEAVRSLIVQTRRSVSLAERVERALRATGYPALRTIEVSVHCRRVVLKGRVPSYYMKQMAQAVTLAVAGVQELCNDVEVIPTAPLAPTGLEECPFVFNQERQSS
jgi:osmotically-inducible protein OsmY